MKIKSLLLGSAAALVAVSGAKAADAVIAEPEPVEYVRVCDAYGVSFFYIPGTETCLSITGYVWFQVATNDFNAGDTPGYYGPADAWGVTTRARLNFDARSDTEWGTLRGFIRLQADWDPANQVADQALVQLNTSDGEVFVDQAFIELGGLRMGYSESAWAQTQNGGASNWGSHSWGGMYYGYQQRNLIAYTFTGGNGFFGTISIEDDGNANYIPDFVVKAGVNQGWGSVWAKVGFDEDLGPALGARAAALSGIDGWAASIGAQFNIPNSPGSSLRVIGFYAENANAYSVGSEFSILASYNHQFSSTLGASIAAQYFSDTNYAAAGSPDGWGAELSIVWFPVTNFEVRTEIHYDDFDGFNSGTTSGFLRFTRYF